MAYPKSRQQYKPRGRIRSKRSLATMIPKSVRANVKLRDNNMCVVCGSMHNIELHHLVERSLGGMGIENNLMCLCQYHHRELHNGRGEVLQRVQDYMDIIYPYVTKNERKYRRK